MSSPPRAGALVSVYHRDPAGSPGAVADAYEASRELLAAAPGLLADRLLAAAGDPRTLVLLMEWAELADFQEWENRLHTSGGVSPLRPYQDRSRAGGHYEVHVVRRTRMY